MLALVDGELETVVAQTELSAMIALLLSRTKPGPLGLTDAVNSHFDRKIVADNARNARNSLMETA